MPMVEVSVLDFATMKRKQGAQEKMLLCGTLCWCGCPRKRSFLTLDVAEIISNENGSNNGMSKDVWDMILEGYAWKVVSLKYVYNYCVGCGYYYEIRLLNWEAGVSKESGKLWQVMKGR